MKHFYRISIILLAFIPVTVESQVPLKTVVEHFTNTNCSICASRNPGFYSNLNNQTNTLHLAVHPSAPYNSCLLYQQNPAANDARTNYYGIYGGTPRIVINGDVISASANYSSGALFTPYMGLTSPASIRIDQQKFGTDSIRCSVIIKTEASHSLGSLSLFVALAEDTVFYTGNNGEPMHFDVFRKSLTNTTGNALAISNMIGDSIVYTFSSVADPVWDFDRIYVMAILQQNVNKEVVQAEATSPSDQTVITGLPGIEANLFQAMFPNPSNGILNIDLKPKENITMEIFSSQGKLVKSMNLQPGTSMINIEDLAAGSYIVRLSGLSSVHTRQLIKY
jgi:hypothetical protein